MADEIENYQLLPTPIKTVIPALRNNSKAIILNSRIMATYDLLENDSFYVNFDTPTPRPHFMVLPKTPNSIEHDFSLMTLKQTEELMKAVRSMMARFDIPSGTLSIHRGSWLSENTDVFHAHICVDVDLYLHVFDQQKSIIPYWPNKGLYVTNNWKANKDPIYSSYLQNVRAYPYGSYLKKEVTAIEKLLGVPSRILPEVNVPGISVILHPSHPKIGFVGMKTIPLEDVVWAIEKFSQELGLTTRSKLNDKDCYYDGCHVCLHLGSGKFIYTAYFVR